MQVSSCFVPVVLFYGLIFDGLRKLTGIQYDEVHPFITLYKPISHPSVMSMSRELNFLSFNTSPKPTGNDHVISLITIVLLTFQTRYQRIFYGYTSSTELKTS